MALEDTLSPPASVLLAGDAAMCAEWHRRLERALRPAVRIYNVAGADLPAALVKGTPPAGGAVAWVCRGTVCLPPVNTVEEVERILSS
jgi:uncharacterized protein YyaL (SSP411 family)